MNKSLYLLFFSTIILIVFGINFLGLLNPNKLVLKVSSEGTPPTDFDVVWGEYKINALKPDSLKHIETENYCISTTKRDDFLNIWDGNYDHYYIVDIKEIVGVVKETPDSKWYYPIFKITKWKKVFIFFVETYIFIVFILIITTIVKLINIAKNKRSDL
jgi:hypothetical protein